MNILKKFAASVALITSSFIVDATVISAGGVTWDSEQPPAVSGTYNFQQWFTSPGTLANPLPAYQWDNVTNSMKVVSNTAVAPGTGVLTGVGFFDTLYSSRTPAGGFGAPTYCTAGAQTCTLGFNFGGLIPTSPTTFDTTNAFLNIYFITNGASLASIYAAGELKDKLAALQNGSLWMSLKFEQFVLKSGSLINGGAVEGLLKATGGLADVFNLFNGGNGFQLTGSGFFSNANGTCGGYTCPNNANGSFQTIPASSPFALLAIGLLCFGAVARKSKTLSN